MDMYVQYLFLFVRASEGAWRLEAVGVDRESDQRTFIDALTLPSPAKQNQSMSINVNLQMSTACKLQEATTKPIMLFMYSTGRDPFHQLRVKRSTRK